MVYAIKIDDDYIVYFMQQNQLYTYTLNFCSTPIDYLCQFLRKQFPLFVYNLAVGEKSSLLQKFSSSFAFFELPTTSIVVLSFCMTF